jgi:hypothetical protein
MVARKSAQKAHREAQEVTSVDGSRLLALLAYGEIGLVGSLLTSSNFTFLVTIDDDELHTLGIYKPVRGETPLWDFSAGTLCLREVAAYVVSQSLGWPLIPPVVLRDGLHGPGTVQLYIDADPDAHYFTLRENRLDDLLPIALFDLLANNADRKGGHLLLDHNGRIWAIDNALTFHRDPKLRTVIWDFAGDSIPEPFVSDLDTLRKHLAPETTLHQTLAKLLDDTEITALRERVKTLVSTGVFPQPDPTRRQVPWPIV